MRNGAVLSSAAAIVDGRVVPRVSVLPPMSRWRTAVVLVTIQAMYGAAVTDGFAAVLLRRAGNR